MFGEGVNIAARLMPYAEPGDIVTTQATAKGAHDVIATLPTVDMGEIYLKNISRPVRALGG